MYIYIYIYLFIIVLTAQSAAAAPHFLFKRKAYTSVSSFYVRTTDMYTQLRIYIYIYIYIGLV